jgi:TonB family protein
MKLKNILIQIICIVALLGVATALDDSNRKVVERVQPEYTEFAKRMNLHGTVKLKAWIGSDGTVTRTEYVSGHPMLADSALKAVKKWKYEPAGKETMQLIEVAFQ